MGKHIILENIVDEVKSSPFCSILADEVTSHNIETNKWYEIPS